MNHSLIDKVISGHQRRFGLPPQAVAYAPGRIEILGNHTDYNEGYVLSAAIDMGICVAVSAAEKKHCILAALDAGEETEFELPAERPVRKPLWANYLIGVVNKLGGLGPITGGFNAAFAGDVPLGAGLSSSAALEVATALGLCSLFRLEPQKMKLGQICQQAENEFTGARCGLLDQISSLFGAEHALVFTDFRLLTIETVTVGADMCFLMANTGVKHSLVESAYNERRASCEQAARFFASVLNHPVRALRDVSPEELKKYSSALDQTTIRRATHIIEENARVLAARQLLQNRRMQEFGRLMFASHKSSRYNFENSCPELDFIVDTASCLPQVLGARLSGGGFGGSAVLLVHPRDTAQVAQAVSSAYAARFGASCSVRAVKPSAGARLLSDTDLSKKTR